MWRCPTCGRSFQRPSQAHSCQVITVDEHFTRRPTARILFDRLVAVLTEFIGPCEPVALRCCIHLALESDFLAVLPKRDRLEVRFVLPHVLDHPRVTRSVRISAHAAKHSVDVVHPDDIDAELVSWIKQAAQLAVR